MIVTLKLAASARAMADQQESISWEIETGATVGVLLAAVAEKYPGFKASGVHGAGKVPDHVDIFINGNNIRFRDHLDTRLKPEDTVYIIPALAGG